MEVHEILARGQEMANKTEFAGSDAEVLDALLGLLYRGGAGRVSNWHKPLRLEK